MSIVCITVELIGLFRQYNFVRGSEPADAIYVVAEVLRFWVCIVSDAPRREKETWRV
jgi:hypothetical protein